ncbi:MAG: thioesterase family protein [Acidimicrobiales bacterium]
MDDSWVALQGVHGGCVAAVALRACEAVVVPTDPQQPPRSLRAATVGFVRGTEVGDLVIEVESVREGRLLTTSHVTTIQGGKVTTVSRFHHSAPSTGTEFSDVAPALSQPSEVVDVADWERPRHITKVDTLMSPSTVPFAGADRAQWLAWSRPVGTGSFDAAWLLMYGDYFPPAVFVRSSAPSRAVTVEYSMQIHDGAGSWTLDDDERLSARVHAFHSRDGYAVEDGWIHLPDGRLLATTRQTRLAG